MHVDVKNGETVLTDTEPLYPALHRQPATTESPSELAGHETAATQGDTSEHTAQYITQHTTNPYIE